MKKDILKNVVILILALGVIVLISLRLLNPTYSTETKNLLQNVLASQVKLSEYLGKLRADTFDAYSLEQLVIGSSKLDDIENSVIVDTEGNELVSLVDAKENVKQDGDTKYYKVNLQNFNKVLDEQLINDANLTWYISSNGVIKVSYSHVPKWWQEEFEVFYIK